MKRFKAVKAYLVSMLILSIFVVLPGCSGDDGIFGGGTWTKPLVSIEVTPASRSMANGTTQQFMATGIYSNNEKRDLTSSVTWSSSNTAVASISNTAGSNGLAASRTVGGPITITATDPASGRAGSASLTVTAATLTSIGVTQVNQSIALGSKLQFKATGIYTDLTKQDLTSSVTWSSSNTAIASISNTAGSNGLASALSVGGPITITATNPATGMAGATTLRVTAAILSSIGITPINPTIALGTTQQFKATGIYSDLTKQDLTAFVTWSSSNTAVATISNPAVKGSASSVAAGLTTITATDTATGKTGTSALTVTTATLTSIGVTPVKQSIAVGATQQFIATGTYSDFTKRDLTSAVTWSSSNVAVATISNAAGTNGVATSKATSALITITATDPVSGKTGTAALTVTTAVLSSIAITPANPSITLGSTQQFVATGTYSDFTKRDLTASVTWTTTPLVSPVAIISNAAGSDGLATALAVGGPITITATDPATGKTGSTTLKVTSATLSLITVTPGIANITIGDTQQFIATGTYSDNTKRDITSAMTWTTTPLVSPVATISNLAGFDGLATALAAGGPITITATDPVSKKTGTATLNVTAATLTLITVTPGTASITIGGTQQFVATGTYSDNTTRILTSAMTWSTTPLVSPVASISNLTGFDGLATALAAGGPLTITATDPVSKKFGTASLTVIPAPLPVTGVVNLAAVAPFGSFGGTAGMTNTGTLTIIKGDIGTIATSTASITGFHDTSGDIYTETPANIGAVTGKIYTCTNSTVGPTSTGPNAAACLVASNARLAAQTAYLALVAMPAGADPGGNLAGKTLVPGVYTAPSGSFMIQGLALTLDAQGDPNAVWVFQMATTLTVGGPGAAFPQNIILAGGAQSKNIFWQVGSFATINAAGGGTMEGTIISQSGAAFSTAGNVQIVTLNGRALSLGAAVTLVDTVINVPAP